VCTLISELAQNFQAVVMPRLEVSAHSFVPKVLQPVIVVKKKAGHAGHHGGAWKVAYADFVTAMMAFFLVMWLVNQSKPVKAAIGGYFRDPAAFDASGGRGVLPGSRPGFPSRFVPDLR